MILLFVTLALQKKPAAPAHLPDMIAYTERVDADNQSERADLYVCDLEGKNNKLIARNVNQPAPDSELESFSPNEGDNFSWSPDGARLYFDKIVDDKTVVFVVHRDGQGLKLLTPDNCSDAPLRWISPTELGVARTVPHADAPVNVVIDVQSGKQTKTKYWSVDYSPDHRYEAADQPNGTVTGLSLIDTQTHKNTMLVKNEQPGLTAVWSPNSKYLAVNWVKDDFKPIVYDTANPSRVMTDKNDGSISDMLWSPDGRYVAWRDEGDLYRVRVLDVTTGKINNAASTSGDLLGWTRDSKFILAALPGAEEGKQTVSLIPVGGGKIKDLFMSGVLGTARISGYERLAPADGSE